MCNNSRQWPRPFDMGVYCSDVSGARILSLGNAVRTLNESKLIGLHHWHRTPCNQYIQYIVNWEWMFSSRKVTHAYSSK